MYYLLLSIIYMLYVISTLYTYVIPLSILDPYPAVAFSLNPDYTHIPILRIDYTQLYL